VLSSIEKLGSYPIFLAAVVMAGIIQLILGYAKAGIIGYYFPSAVIKGMLSGIGLIIILKQIPHAFGYDSDYEGDLSFMQADGHNTFSEFFYMMDGINPGALVITLASLIILILWEQPFIKKFKITQVIQGPLIVVTLGIILNILFKDNPSLMLYEDEIVKIPVADDIAGFFGQFTFPDFSAVFNSEVLLIAATIAIVASLETLLCVEATDKIDPQKRVTPTNRELKAQGLGNIVSGLIGGLPITQVIVRSSANIQSGGKTKLSAFLHGVLLLIAVMFIPNILNLIPLASLAAILIIVGFKLAKPNLFKEMYRMGVSQFVPFMVTIVGILFTDLLIGIALGMAVAIFHILRNNFKTPYFFNLDEYKEGEKINIVLSEDVSFLNKAGILQTLNHLPENCDIVLDASRTKNIHPDILEIIDDFSKVAESRNIKLELKNFPDGKKKDSHEEFSKVIINHKNKK
ncbi:MAG: SulP family inorganic anion transporter, partial [Cyclobacteriaceae bacterium]|nr:SulP family inorganic anion transporter [Cyclobacteriaceae bacterium]